jgi:hypothetical protein
MSGTSQILSGSKPIGYFPSLSTTLLSGKWRIGERHQARLQVE